MSVRALALGFATVAAIVVAIPRGAHAGDTPVETRECAAAYEQTQRQQQRSELLGALDSAELLLREVSPTHAMYETYEPRIELETFCLYPLYYARYTYSGEARRHPSEQLFVAVSGKTGEVVAASYPSKARSVAAKVRRLLSFDRRGA